MVRWMAMADSTRGRSKRQSMTQHGDELIEVVQRDADQERLCAVVWPLRVCVVRCQAESMCNNYSLPIYPI